MQNAQQDKEITEDKTDIDKPLEKGVGSAVFNQQNNFHLIQSYDIEKITNLSIENPALADRLMKLYEKQQEHNIYMDKEILDIEKKEQQIRVEEQRYQRKFAFRALNFAMGLSILSLGCSIYFVYNGHYILAGTAISIPIGVAVSNMLGFKSSVQSKKKEKSTEKKE